MFTHRITLFRAFGFPIRIDLSWLIIATVVAWSLSANFFPHAAPELSVGAYWIMGTIGMLGLFASVLLHELGHALVARRFGMEMEGITLFIFGGVAEMTSDPPNPKAEFWVAVGGPLVSLVLAVALTLLFAMLSWPATVGPVIQYLGFINGLLLVFNLVPAFPLDGGRVLRSILWATWGSLRRATRTASRIGAAFGWFLIGLGIFHLLSGYVVSAIWWALLGFFVRQAATMGYQQVIVRKLLEGHPVSRFMNDAPITINPDHTLEQVVENYVYRHGYKFYPVLSGRDLVGCITVSAIKDTPRDKWGGMATREIMRPVGNDITIAPDADAMEALERMHRGQLSRLLVVRDNQLEGVLTLKDLMRFLAMKIELGAETR